MCRDVGHNGVTLLFKSFDRFSELRDRGVEFIRELALSLPVLGLVDPAPFACRSGDLRPARGSHRLRFPQLFSAGLVVADSKLVGGSAEAAVPCRGTSRWRMLPTMLSLSKLLLGGTRELSVIICGGWSGGGRLGEGRGQSF
ncbi:hypothetical protein PF005_g25181 [Phytophthora fragariae]|uniref:Uncharacterized protein n=1 Tax=Phytophthora fragariae TaxID=53985 RepID=A0A6A3RG81_9STRA|nr:hypothetical protein PF003_g34564 [Phytophthora fragariae]KAE8923819.1 hypothetical protein PF009_g25937 [Phytophthora fragariae]KAE8976808.1 hypothetical protein PF011_g23902 [Phytophthora fragariae]KAE9074927.1 hypothetical protein PF007_g25211 [Phytophthora fragariae]KAE9075856.1 hypothetical protein PF010_g24140 [Phytophthora fragariae]